MLDRHEGEIVDRHDVKYAMNGYRETETPYGRGVSVEDVGGLHTAIAHALVEEKPSLSGPEVRFIRKLLELTQTQLAELLGVEDQSVRRWEKLARVPKQADHSIRLVFRDLTHRDATPLPELLRQIESAEAREPRTVRYRFRANAKERWQPQEGRAMR
jgi:DNA-binding transcriptional regulator YiaG